MKFVKGMIFGSMISAGVAMMYSEGINWGKRKMIKKGKQMAKKMGIL